MSHRLSHGFAVVCLLLSIVSPAFAQEVQKTREEKVREDKERFAEDESWIYNDLADAKRIAAAEKKPLLVIFRCLPCEACALFDEQVVRRNEKIRALMDRFICARIPMANAIDLTQFQFDYDLSFFAFFMNADDTIYGRFGTRSARGIEHSEKDISLEGFAAALEGALKLHAGYPGNEKFLAGKQPREVKYEKPDDFPSLKGKYGNRLNYEGKVVQSCMHCHQIRDAEREVYRKAGKPMPPDVLYPYPMPSVVGFYLDPKTRATVRSVEEGSAAAEAGLQAGDEILTFDSQAILSIADVQWVLHTSPATGQIPVSLRRDGQVQSLSIPLETDWRKATDISWRVTTWPFRRMVTGGMLLVPLDEAERRRLDIGEGEMALLAEHVGQYGPHAAAKRAGFQKGDVIVSVDGRTDLLTEPALMAHLLGSAKVGGKVEYVLVRNGRRQTKSIPMQP